jgi:hypothetical protein
MANLHENGRLARRGRRSGPVEPWQQPGGIAEAVGVGVHTREH